MSAWTVIGCGHCAMDSDLVESATCRFFGCLVFGCCTQARCRGVVYTMTLHVGVLLDAVVASMVIACVGCVMLVGILSRQ